MATSNYWTQAPDEARLYQQAVAGDTIQSATWTLSPAGATIGTPLNQTNTTSVLISGLTAGVVYQGLVHIVCASGQILDAAFTLACQSSLSPP